MIRLICSLFLAAILLASCKKKHIDYRFTLEKAAYEKGFFTKEIPTFTTGKMKDSIDWIYDYFKKQTSEIGLSSIENGYNGLQIRIWLNHWLAINRHLIILKYMDSVWSGEVVTLTYAYNDSLQEHYIAKKEFKNITPKNGWDRFIELLAKQKILDLPNMNRLPGYDAGDDGIDYVFEIAAPNKYRMYHYWEPSSFKDKFWQAENVLNIGNLLNEELSINYTN